ncbi:MAG TPA: sodium:solute symporter [Saprospiraceae bacterium]|nr:sodium:solute symporter [Saprospiraceae bacterium]
MIQQLTPGVILGIISAYFLLLIIISWFTGRDSSNESFFLAGRQSPWFVVAFGMIGASLSGVTFISIPGAVGAGAENQAFAYMQIVFGYLLGYVVIALVLLPLYYRLNLTSIYSYLEQRLGFFAYKTGAAYFLLSRAIGSSFRLFLVAIVIQRFVMDAYGIPFWLTVLATIALIWVYTFRGGIKTVVWTDTLQTFCMITSVILTIIYIGQALEMDVWGLTAMIRNSEYSQVFFFKGGWNDPNNFFKQFFSGALITIVMTGLDQDMMQKNLTCRSLRDAQKNMFTFSFILIFVNLLFLALGALLYLYAASVGLDIPERSDQLYPTIAIQHLAPVAGIVFILGLIAAAYSSADSTLTALTTSFCIDFLDLYNQDRSEADKKRMRIIVHVGMSFLLFFIVLFFAALNNTAVINQLFKAAGYTYGPLLGLFTFGILLRRQTPDTWVVVAICVAAPVLSFVIDTYSEQWFNGFKFGFLILAFNGLLTFLGLLAISKPAEAATT